MLGVYVNVPVACFRKGLARELFETHLLPPPSTCYGFLLSLVGETDRCRHVGCRVTPTILGRPAVSTVLRTLWRIKAKTLPQGTGRNATPGHQQLLSHVELVLWLDSTDEEQSAEAVLEKRVATALDLRKRGRIDRFGGLSMGESTHLVDEVALLSPLRSEELLDSSPDSTTDTAENTLIIVERDALLGRFPDAADRQVFLCRERGRLDLPVWVDHVGSAGTRYVVGDLLTSDLQPPNREEVPQISDK